MSVVRQVDIDLWLSEMGLAQYVEAFRAQAIDSAVLPTLTDADLRELTIPLGHRKKILAGIETLKARHEEAASIAIERPSGVARNKSRAGVEAERRQLTVMFSDLIGSTALSARLDPEDLRRVIQTYQNAVASAVERYDGHVAKFLGDGVLVYFGHPRAHEDDAERAVRAGLAVVQAVARQRLLDVELQCRIGIATGLVVVGESLDLGAALEQAVIGETPNLAARLQEFAPPGGVVLADSTRKLLGASFEIQPLGQLRLKGLNEPVSAWIASGERTVGSRFEAAHAQGLTRFIGRDSEVALLLDRWNMARDGEGQVLLLTGEAGIGKSRICQTMRERLAREPHTEVIYQCSPYHAGSALYPVVRQIELAADIDYADTLAVRLEKFERSLVAAGLDPERSNQGLLMRLVGLPDGGRLAPSQLSPQKEKAQTLQALIERLQQLATRQPVLLLVEDAHWIDPTSEELIGLAVERLKDSRLLLVVTFRPDYAPPWDNPTHLTRLTMPRLGRRHCTALVEAVAEGKALPSELLDEIIAKTDGMPLFAEELTKTILASGQLEEGGGAYRLKGPLPSLAIPSSLQDMLMARLDRLARGKEVAQVGAAIGREFSYRVLSKVLNIEEGQVLGALAELLRTELVFQRGAPPDATYSFKHALIRDAAYDSMLKSRRQACHAKIGEVIERDEPDTVANRPELLAYHYQQGGQDAVAFKFWSVAGDLAARRSASREAARHYRSGLALLQHLPDTAERSEREFELNMKLANSLMQSEGYSSPDAQLAYSCARTIAAKLGQTEKYASACIEMAPTILAQARYRDAMDLFNNINAQHLAEMDPVTRVRLGAMTGVVQLLLGNFDEAWRVLDEAKRLDDVVGCTHERPHGGADPAIVLRDHGATIRYYQGYPEQAHKLAEEGMVIARERGHEFTIAWAELGSARMAMRLGAFEEGVRRLTRLADLCERRGFAARQGTVLLSRGRAYLGLGRLAEGLSDLSSGLRLWTAAGGRFHVSHFAADAADALIEAGLCREAEEFVTQAEQVQRDTDERIAESEVLRLRGQLLLADGNRTAAKEHLIQAVDVASRRGARLMELRAATDLARLMSEAGDRREAVSLLQPVYGWFTEGFDFLPLAQARALLRASGSTPTSPSRA